MNVHDKVRVVIDTNVIVSALWSKHNRLTQLLSLVLNDTLLVCHDAAIIQEYEEVLRRPQLAFHFEAAVVSEIIGKMKADGLSVVVRPSAIPLPDEDDRKFYDVANMCQAYLVTSNIRHFPSDAPFVVNPFDFLKLFESGSL